MRFGFSRRSRRSPVPSSLAPKSYSWRIRNFLGSRGHIVGMFFALAGILLFNAGWMTGLLGLGAIAALYVTGYFVAERPTQKALAPQRTADAPQLRDSLDEMLAAINKRVSSDIYYLVRSIRDAAVFTLENAGGSDATDPDVHLVRRTATTYLPEALSTYMALPRNYAENKQLDDGRTAHDVLMDQLSTMDEQTRRVAADLIKRNSQRLVTHERFVTDRYATSGLNVPATPTTTPAQAPVPAESDVPADQIRVH